MSKRTGEGGEGPKISLEERTRIARSARQLVSYVNFLRWAANFRRDEITRHPNHDRVMLLSPMQSGRFSFAIEGDTLILGVQAFEAAWAAYMPFECAYVSDRLYLCVQGVGCMDAKMPPLTLGIFVDDSKKRALMSTALIVQPVRVTVRDGAVDEVGRAVGVAFPMKTGDIIKQLVLTAREQPRQQDMGRYF